MSKVRIKTDGKGSAQEIGKIETYKAKPKPYREPDFIRKLRLDRERWFWQKYPEQRTWIEEFVAEMKKEWLRQDKRK